MRLNYRRTFLVGSAFLGVQVLFAVYSAYVPIFLQSGRPDFTAASPVAGGFAFGATLTGFLVALDNLTAILMLPLIGVLSDATVSRMGKRKPYILAGAPVTALAFAALPLTLDRAVWVFMLAMVLMILAVNVIRTPIMALMPDITPAPLRTQANGVINLMGGIGAAVGFLVGGLLYRHSPSAPFFFGASMLLVGCLLVVALLPVSAGSVVHEAHGFRQQLRAEARNQIASLYHDLRLARHGSDRSLVYLLATIFCLFLASSALTVFFTSFAVVNLGTAPGQAAQLLTLFALAVTVFALPAGLLGTRIGGKRAIQGGLVIFLAATLPMTIVTSPLLIGALLVAGGAGWALIIVNALPLVLDSAPAGQFERVGAYTGMYFLATQSAEAAGPVLAGRLLDLGGRDYRLIFAYTSIAVVAALTMLVRVRPGAAHQEITAAPVREP